MHCALFRPEIEPDVRVIGGCGCKLATYVIPSDPANHRIPLNLGALGVIQFKDQFNPVAFSEPVASVQPYFQIGGRKYALHRQNRRVTFYKGVYIKVLSFCPLHLLLQYREDKAIFL